MAWPVYTDIASRTGLDIETTGVNEGKIVYSDVSQHGLLDITEVLTRARAFCASYCKRDPAYGFDEQTITSEIHDGGSIIQVDHPPIVSMTSVIWDTTTLDEDDEDFYVYTRYVAIPSSELKTLESYGRHKRTRKIVTLAYTGGYSDEVGDHTAIPAELKDIVLDVACRWVLKYDENYRRDYGATQVKIGEWSVKFDEEWLNLIHDRLRNGPWYCAGVA